MVREVLGLGFLSKNHKLKEGSVPETKEENKKHLDKLLRRINFWSRRLGFRVGEK